MPVQVFGEGAVQSAYVSYTALDISANSLTLVWPTSYFDVPSTDSNGTHYNVLAASMTVTNGPEKGISAPMVAGVITIPATSVQVGSNIQLTLNTFGTAHGQWYVSTIVPGVSFTVTSRGAGAGSETSTISWGVMPPDILQGTSNALSGGQIFVSAPGVTASSNILLTYATNPTTNGGILSAPVANIQPGIGFTIFSTNMADTAQVNWVITNLSPGIIQGTAMLGVGTGSVMVLAPSVTVNSVILLSYNTPNNPSLYIRVSAIDAGVGFTITAQATTDISSIYWDILPGINNIVLPDATESSVGSNFIITNTGQNSFQLLKSDKSELLSIPNTGGANSYWVQLTNNTSAPGKWQFVQFGAGTSQAQASALAGNGLVALSNLLNTNIVVDNLSASPYQVLVEDRAKLFLWNGGTGTMNLPLIADVPAGFYISVNNPQNGSILTITGDATIDNNASIIINTKQSLTIITDGTKWWTLGLGQNISLPLAISNGGTGQSTRQAALNALMPTTPAIGDLLYFDGTNWIRLPIGTVGQVLTVAAGIPTWA